MALFYTPEITEKFYTLPEEESKHCIRTLRKKEGDIIALTNGKGTFYKAEIVLAHPKRCQINIISSTEIKAPAFNLQIAIAPTKNINRFELFLEKTTEIGIDRITPLICRYSERKTIKHERLEKVLIAAMKQSKKAYKPQLDELTKFENFIKQEFQGQKFIAHCYKGKKQKLKTIYKINNNTLILIGPEGDFSEQEVALAKANGFEEITLSNARLRTETAGIVACSAINLLNF